MTSPRPWLPAAGAGSSPKAPSPGRTHAVGSCLLDTGASAVGERAGQRPPAALPAPRTPAAADRAPRRGDCPGDHADRPGGLREDDARSRMAPRPRGRRLVSSHAASADVGAFSAGSPRRWTRRPRAPASGAQRLGSGRDRAARPTLAELLAEDLEAWPAGGIVVLDDYHLWPSRRPSRTSSTGCSPWRRSASSSRRAAARLGHRPPLPLRRGASRSAATSSR